VAKKISWIEAVGSRTPVLGRGQFPIFRLDWEEESRLSSRELATPLRQASEIQHACRIDSDRIPQIERLSPPSARSQRRRQKAPRGETQGGENIFLALPACQLAMKNSAWNGLLRLRAQTSGFRYPWCASLGLATQREVMQVSCQKWRSRDTGC
jgi:hypothetical protein